MIFLGVVQVSATFRHLFMGNTRKTHSNPKITNFEMKSMEFTPGNHGFLEAFFVWLTAATKLKNEEFIAFISNTWGLKEQMNRI